MKLYFDATILQQPATGIAKATLGLYEACASLMPSLEIAALHRQQLECPLSNRIQSIQFGADLPEVLWRQISLPMYSLNHPPKHIHFPWNGYIPHFFSDTTIISTIHDVLPLIIPGYFKSKIGEKNYRKRIQRDINRSDIIITDSNYSRKQIMENFETNNPPIVIYPATNLSKSNVILEPEKDYGEYFLYVGGYNPRKGLDILLRTFIKLNQNKELSSKLILTGQKNYFSIEFKKLVEKGKNLGFVQELGYVSDNQLAGLYSNAKALVYPSRYEGFGLPPLEAMTLGCPVITTKCTSIPEICGDAACYVELEDDIDLANKLIAMENSDENVNKLKKLGKERAAKFSWTESAKIFLDSIFKD